MNSFGDMIPTDIGSLSMSRNRTIFVYLRFGFLGYVVYLVIIGVLLFFFLGWVYIHLGFHS